MGSKAILRVSCFLASMLFFSAIGCKKSDFNFNRSSYIIGPSNDIVLVDRSVQAKINDFWLQSAVLLTTRLSGNRVKFCSGTLISERSPGNPRVLTNHHCFALSQGDGRVSEEVVKEACSQTKVYFGFIAGQTKEVFSLGCENGSLRTNFASDLAVFTLSGKVPTTYQPMAIYKGSGDGAGRRAVIAHYPEIESHLTALPGSDLKLPALSVTIRDCQVLGEFPFSEWDLDRSLPYSLRHSCDLINGSSGSGLIDADTKTLLGVNWGGIKVETAGGDRIDNVATKASVVASFLDGSLAAEEASLMRRRAAALAAERAGLQKKSPRLRVGKKRFGCGVILNSARSNPRFSLMALFTLPLLIVARRRKG